MNTIIGKGFKFGLWLTVGGIFCLGLAGDALAAPPLDLKISDGKVSGTVDNRPVIDVLNLLSRKGLFKFRVNGDLAQHPVSGKFKEASLIDALKQILRPFNTLLLSNTKGHPETIFILNLRSGDPSEGPAQMEAAIPGSGKGPGGTPQFLTIDDFNLTDEQRAGFDIAGEKRGPPPEMMDLFYPKQEPGTEKTGPRSPMDYDMPEFPGGPLSQEQMELTEEQRAAFDDFRNNPGPPPGMDDQFYPPQLPEAFKNGPPAN